MDVFSNNIIVKGGWVMIPIILGCIIALGLTVERGILFWKIRLDIRKFADDIFSLVDLGHRDLALESCTSTRHPIGSIFNAGLVHWGEDSLNVERIMELTGNEELTRLEKI